MGELLIAVLVKSPEASRVGLLTFYHVALSQLGSKV